MGRNGSRAGALVFGFALIANPAFLFAGCGFDFGEKEAVALVAQAGAHKTYRFTVDGSDYEATVDLAQAKTATPKLSVADVSFVASAHACGERTFVRSAGACLDITKVPVEGTITVMRVTPTPEVVVDRQRMIGNVLITGTSLHRASVELVLKSRQSAPLL